MTYLTTASFSSFLLLRLVERCSSKFLANFYPWGPIARSTAPRRDYGTTTSQPPESRSSTPEASSHNEDDAISPTSVKRVARLGLEFCLLWFTANFCVAKALEYTTVATCTILASTSGLWTLLIGATFEVEAFTLRKLLAVLLSIVGIALVSSADLSGNGSSGLSSRKSFSENLAGELLALSSAVMYGIYTILIKKRAGSVNTDILLFFGFVGTLNTILLWPGFLVLDKSGLEEFELPPSGRVWSIILVRPS